MRTVAMMTMTMTTIKVGEHVNYIDDDYIDDDEK